MAILGGGNPGQVEIGEAGIEGLAKALGGNLAQDEAPEGEEPKRKKRRGDGEKAVKESGEGLLGVIGGRKAQAAGGSALKMKSSDKHKKKKKEKKEKKKKEKGKKESSGSDDDEYESSSSESDSLFQLAALPQGVDRIHRIHQEKPGALADLTLRRFRELLNRSIGGGTATNMEEMPAVARAYLSQIYLPKNTEAAIGLRNLRELRTLALLVDLVAGNDPLRALDVAIQRMKSIEVFIAQGQWSQATLLELVLPEDEQRAFFRQELKAAQQEHKSELKLQKDQYPRRRQNWSYAPPTNSGGEKKEAEAKDDVPPGNGGGTGKGKKGKGKGKKGFRRW